MTCTGHVHLIYISSVSCSQSPSACWTSANQLGRYWYLLWWLVGVFHAHIIYCFHCFCIATHIFICLHFFIQDKLMKDSGSGSGRGYGEWHSLEMLHGRRAAALFLISFDRLSHSMSHHTCLLFSLDLQISKVFSDHLMEIIHRFIHNLFSVLDHKCIIFLYVKILPWIIL